MDHVPLPLDLADSGESIVLLKFEPPDTNAPLSSHASPEHLCELAIKQCRAIKRPLLVADLRGHAYINAHRVACLLLAHKEVSERGGRTVVLVSEADTDIRASFEMARLDRILTIKVLRA